MSDIQEQSEFMVSASEMLEVLRESQQYAVEQIESVNTKLAKINQVEETANAIASDTQLGRVKVDGQTINADANGVISSVGGGSGSGSGKPYASYTSDEENINPSTLEDGAIVAVDQQSTTTPIGFSRSVGELVFSLVSLTDPGLHLLDGSVLSENGVYAEGVAKIASLQSTHPNLFVSENDWQTSVTNYGVCGKFVWDSEAKTLRLPKVTGFMEATIDSNALGDLVEAGLPNITGGVYNGQAGVSSIGYQGATGAFGIDNGYGGKFNLSNSGSTTYPLKLIIDASRSSGIYGNSGTVQPQSVKGFIYIVLANSLKTPITVNALAGKSNVDLNNVTSSSLDNVISICTNNNADDMAAAHNCIYRGKDLTNVYTLDELSAKLSAGDFSDLYIGDYITYPYTHAGETKNVNFRFGHFNYWKYMGDSVGFVTVNHILMVPDTPLYSSQMQTSNTTAGGVPASIVWMALQAGTYNEINVSTCMNGHVISHRDLIPDSVSNSASDCGGGFTGSTVYASSVWHDVKLGLMPEPMVYGGKVFSSSGNDIGCGKSQIALFRLDPTWITGRADRYYWWAGAVSSSTYFALAGGAGVAYSANASLPYGVRPYFLFA